MAELTVAVVGLGWWGRTIVGYLSASEKMQVVAGVDPAPAALAFCQAHSIEASSDYAAVLADPRIDAVVLCTPHRFHAEQIIAAAEAGKHVFCEKPLCTTASEALSALQAVHAAGVQIGVGHERRFEPAVLQLRESIAAGELGEILVVEGNFSQDKFLALPPGNWRLSIEEAPVGPLTATGIHLVDLSVALLGAPSRVWSNLSARGAGFANGDTLTVSMEFKGGGAASITAVLATPFIGRLMVIGSHGWVEIRDRSHPEHPTGWDVTTVWRGHSPRTAFHPPHDAVRDNLEAFAVAALGGAAYPVPVQEMLATMRALDAITRSAASEEIEAV